MINIAVQLVEVAALPSPDDPHWASRFSDAELAYCTGLRYAADHLAARAAAKQAALAALGLSASCWGASCWGASCWGASCWGASCWAAVEIRREPGSAPVVMLRGRVEDARRTAGLATPRVSLTHAGGYAAALAWLPGGDG